VIRRVWILEQTYKEEDALVLFSGGQDSTTSLFWALGRFHKVHAICFYYAQKHSYEIACARKICGKLGIDIKVVDISLMKNLVISHLFKHTGAIRPDTHPLRDNVPSSFVPYRNLLFLVLAAAWASSLRSRHRLPGYIHKIRPDNP
jgi:7-cyano-7-deazaguanine synthase